MRVHVQIQQPPISVNETMTGNNAEDVVGQIKARVSKELPFAARLLVGSMSSLGFAQEVVRRYNQSKKLTLPLPDSCQAFLELAQTQGFAVIEEE